MDNNINPTTKCPCCGSDTLDYLGLQKGSASWYNAVLPFATTPVDGPTMTANGLMVHYPVYAKRCSTCGYIALFDKAIVDENAEPTGVMDIVVGTEDKF